jgi:hypothetical protein
MRTDGRTEILEIMVTFRSFWNALKNYTDIYVIIAENVQTLEVIPVKPAQISRDNSRNTQTLNNKSCVVLFSKASGSSVGNGEVLCGIKWPGREADPSSRLLTTYSTNTAIPHAPLPHVTPLRAHGSIYLHLLYIS